MPSPLSVRVPLPLLIARPVAVRLSPSASLALASSSAWVMRRAPLSSAIGASVTGVLTGALSFTGVTVTDTVCVSLSEPSET